MTDVRPSTEAGPAIFSEDRRYRYTLTRHWGNSNPTPRIVNFIGLNPSTADEKTLDPTLRRCVRFALDWGYDAFVMTNLFAYRATDPTDMKAQGLAAIGPENDHYLHWIAAHSETVVAAWGAHGGWLDRDADVLHLLRGLELQCLGRTRSGKPRHPLYLHSDTALERFA